MIDFGSIPGPARPGRQSGSNFDSRGLSEDPQTFNLARQAALFALYDHARTLEKRDGIDLSAIIRAIDLEAGWS
jgi:hypothetical protein